MKNANSNGSLSDNSSNNPFTEFVQNNKILDSLPDAIIITDMQYKIQYFNSAAEKLYGWKESELIGYPLSDYIRNDYLGGSLDAILESISKNGWWKGEVVQNDRKDNRISIITSLSVITDDNNQPYAYLAINRDITKHKQTEEAFKISQERLELATLSSHIGIWDWDIINDNLVWDNQMYQLYGVKEEDFGGAYNAWITGVHPEDRQKNHELTNQALKGEKKFDTEFRVIWPNGSIKYLEAHGTIIRDTDGKPVRMIGVNTDITKRKNAEIALLKSETRISESLDHLIEGCQIIGFNWRFIYLNDAAANQGRKSKEEFIGKNIKDVLPGIENTELFSLLEKCMNDRTPQRMTNEFTYFDGKTGWFELRIQPVSEGIFILSIDITKQRRLEIAMQKAQKLESLGVLAGGIAHDFNNLMGGIYGYIDLALDQSTEKKVIENLSMAINTIDRAKDLTQQLLTFAKGGTPILDVGPLFPFIEETANFALSGSNVSCKMNIDEDLWASNFDRNQIGQVIDNIVINAQQAMPSGGIIELSAKNVSFSEKEHPILSGGNYIKISIKDSGIGIPQDKIPNIFDPFFTTKTKGHGLGLATSYSIVSKHYGCIDIESKEGIGSTFIIYLPASEITVTKSNRKELDIHKGSGVFLIMDDEIVIQDTVSKMLSTFGYATISKENGQQAIDYIKQELEENRNISGMIFDLTVPGNMGGKEAIKIIKGMNIEIPAFVVSGYADDPVMKNPEKYGFLASLCKPFKRTELSEMLNIYL